MEIVLTRAMLEALRNAQHVPDDVRAAVATLRPIEAGSDAGAYLLRLSADEAMELSELLTWHVRTDPATGLATPETAAYEAIIRAIAAQET